MGAALTGSMDDTIIVILLLFELERWIFRPTVVGAVGFLTLVLHEDIIAAITTVIATIRITPTTGETPSSFLPDLSFSDFIILALKKEEYWNATYPGYRELFLIRLYIGLQ